MALLEMKRLVAAMPKNKQSQVVRSLCALSCVEVEPCSAELFSEGGPFVPSAAAANFDEESKELTSACRVIAPYAPKRGLFAQRIAIDADQMLDSENAEKALETARKINSVAAEIENCKGGQTHCNRALAALAPWEPLDLPLSFAGTEKTVFLKGLLPVTVSLDTLNASFAEGEVAAQARCISDADRARYIGVIAYSKHEPKLRELLKNAGFMEAELNYTRTAAEETALLSNRLWKYEDEQRELEEQLKILALENESLLVAQDSCTLRQLQSNALSDFSQSEHVAVMQGWLPAECEKQVSEMLQSEGCAYAFYEPAEGDKTPTAIKNNGFARPFEAVTSMYGTPAYGSKVDPNPFMAPFYILFFGFMMADIGYGLLLLIGCAAALKLMKPTGTMRKMLTLFMYCGFGTLLAGALTGSFFGDALPAFTSNFIGHEVKIPVLLFDPLAEPVKMLILSLLMGLVHIMAGLGVNALRQIREKDYLGALCDTGSWYLIVAGAGLMYFKLSFGVYLIGAGLLLIIVFGGRGKKGLGRFTGGFSKLYDAVGYASDLLSYSRIMALGLSGAVVAQVFNRIGTMLGSGIVGILIFIVVFAIGHAFNLATGLLGAYVHTSRLQYIEFFGKFFAEGGRPFNPLQANTKYTTVTREEH